MRQLIAEEEFTSVQKAQAGLTKVFQEASRKGKFVRVMRNNQPLGMLIPHEMWETFVEDLEALSSEKYLKRIAKSRSSKKRYSSAEVKKLLGLNV